MVLGNVLNKARQSLFDHATVTTVGAKFQNKKIRDYIAFANPEQGELTVIGIRETLVLKEAVFLNGLNAHAPNFDDGTNSGIIHLGSPIFSLPLPLAQRYDVRVEDTLKAAVIGYETFYIVAVSIQPGHRALDYHVTGTCGVLGAAIAVSYMLDFPKKERYNAFAAACVSAIGMLKVLGDSSELKPCNMAKTTLLAFTSIQLAKADFKGHPDPLGGNRGYSRMMTREEDIELKPVVLNGVYTIQRTYTKPYAPCRYTYPSIEVVIELRNEYGLIAGDVESIHTKTYSLAVSSHDHMDIPGSYSAKMSIPYSTATDFLYDRAGLQKFSETGIQDKVVLDLTKRTTVVPDEEISAALPAVQAAVVELKTTDNRTLEKCADFPRGEPEDPLSDEEFRERYHELMGYTGVDRETDSHIFGTVYRENVSARGILELSITEKQESTDE